MLRPLGELSQGRGIRGLSLCLRRSIGVGEYVIDGPWLRLLFRVPVDVRHQQEEDQRARHVEVAGRALRVAEEHPAVADAAEDGGRRHDDVAAGEGEAHARRQRPGEQRDRAAREHEERDAPDRRRPSHELGTDERHGGAHDRMRSVDAEDGKHQRLHPDDQPRRRRVEADLPGSLLEVLDDEEALGALARRDSSPLAAIEVARQLLLSVDVDREDEAQPIMPLARISVTEDMATAMRLHALGWRSIYHHEVLARGLAPEDLRSSLQQRLRWAQGTIQIMLRENPLFMRGLSVGQRLMYFGTMWGYLSGFAAVVYLVAPVLYLLFGILPVSTVASAFFLHIVPYLLINQLFFIVVGWGLPTWRGQQYSLALFPLWIKAITSAIGNVYFGRKLGFVVTPKTRQGGVHLSLIRPQLAAIVLLNIAVVWGLGRLALGL